MSWQLPSLSALRTFETAARHLSFTKAAIELDVTQSAVSRQIALMEEYLGILLFQRVKQRLVLTDAGQRYAADIRAALALMQNATVNLLAHQGTGGALNITTAPAFGTKWLIPRLSRFATAHPANPASQPVAHLAAGSRLEYCWADAAAAPHHRQAVDCLRAPRRGADNPCRRSPVR